MAEAEKIIKKMVEANPAYLLKDNNMFALTEYKVLNGRSRKHLIKCSKVLFNGKIQFVYLVSGYRPLSGLIETISPEELCVIIANLIKAIMDIEEIGFLKCNNLDISFNRLYVNVKTYEIHLIYLPINTKKQDNIEYESRFIKYIAAQLDIIEQAIPGKTLDIRRYFSENQYSLRQIYEKISAEVRRSKSTIADNIDADSNYNAGQPVLVLNYEGDPSDLTFVVDKEKFTVGKRPDTDGQITFNSAISRHHCDFIYKDMKYFVIDMGSSNGTFVNGVRLVPETPREIHSGDIIRLANSDFKAEIREEF